MTGAAAAGPDERRRGRPVRRGDRCAKTDEPALPVAAGRPRNGNGTDHGKDDGFEEF